MLFTDIIRKKRDGGELRPGEIAFFVDGLANGSIPAEQVSALAMAIYINSMSAEEASHLTLAMAASGTVLDWQDEGLHGPVVDKHSTGGVGDKVSFLLAPIAAACGCYVPMISGRGLGHTGGTADKVESIPGYNAAPNFELFKKVVKSEGCAIIGQTADLAPADRRLYAIRDVTATVASVPLITASILSKKIAAGLQALVMDVKFGSGAFMTDAAKAEELAKSIITTAGNANLTTHALITDMNECLGKTAGNAVEIAEAIEFLKCVEREPRLDEVVLALCAEMLISTGLEESRDAARQKADDAVTSGKAAEVFARMVYDLGGPADIIDQHEKHLPVAPISRAVHAAKAGYVTAVDTLEIGNAIIELGGGRRVMEDKLDLSVGLTDVAPIGALVDNERPLAIIHAASGDTAQLAAAMIREACEISDSPPAERPIIFKTLGAD
ncbi:MAG: thymidine phosphorylase [Woeseiaceae bacterium]|nr:thymidine phosphorylase [Woeseiaceae bacterium]